MLSRVSLQRHPMTACTPVTSIDVVAERTNAAELKLEYRLRAVLDDLRMPFPRISQRVDELWRHTCAELFVALPDQDTYLEFNFSPSTEWAAYAFSAYRQGMRRAEVDSPTIQPQLRSDGQVLQVSVRLSTALAKAGQLQLGLCMVIEDRDGQCSYWALAHGAVHPDFHRRDGFTLLV